MEFAKKWGKLNRHRKMKTAGVDELKKRKTAEGDNIPRGDNVPKSGRHSFAM